MKLLMLGSFVHFRSTMVEVVGLGETEVTVKFHDGTKLIVGESDITPIEITSNVLCATKIIEKEDHSSIEYRDIITEEYKLNFGGKSLILTGLFIEGKDPVWNLDGKLNFRYLHELQMVLFMIV